uniref:Capsid protein n=1 Tax=Cressdnaviricota sp. TaxID=2748378 RepID=A0A890UQV4_9VIRU|nr:MAG: capsid protein [Cressdnaviricota sp.]
MSSILARYRPAGIRMSSLYRQALNPTQRRRMSSYMGQRLGRRTRFAAGRSQTMTSRRRVMTRNGILGGTNADTRMIYQRKSMPKKKRRQWRNFVRKVNAVDERDLGTQTVLFNDQIEQSSSTVATSTQNCLTLALYPFRNDTFGYLNDLYQIGTIENAGNPTAAAGTTVLPSTKVLFQSAVLDVTLRNISSQTQDVGGVPTNVQVPEAAIECDVYTIIIRKDAATATSSFDTVSALLNSFDDPEIGGAGVGISIGDRGASPFELGSQMGKYGIRILKKQKFFIPNGQTVTFQSRDPKRHVIQYSGLTSNDGWNNPGWTRVFYMIYKLVPGLTQGTTTGTYRARISVGCTRKYAYKLEGRSENRERLLGASYTPTPVV